MIAEEHGAGPRVAASPPRASAAFRVRSGDDCRAASYCGPATPADIERLADFNVRVHGDELLRAGTWDELGGGHPVVTLRHQLIIEDPASGAIVSAAYLLPMRWRLGSVELPVGQIEVVGTEPAYRRRGLSRRTIQALHAMSASQGHLLTGIVGVRYLYRRFGYEYAVAFDGFRDQARSTVGIERGAGLEVRPARLDDAVALDAMRRTWTNELDLVQVVDAERFRFDIAGHVPRSFMEVSFSVAVDGLDRPIAYARAPTGPDDGWASVTEVVLGAECRGRESMVIRRLAAHVLGTVDAAG